MLKKINPDNYVKALFMRTEQYAKSVKGVYEDTISKLLTLTNTIDLGPDKAFSFADYPKLSEEATTILRSHYSHVYAKIQNGIKAEWQNANIANDKMLIAMFGKGAMEKNHLARYFNRNQEAMEAFFSRKSAYGGLNLSQRIWKYTGQFKTEMEMALTVSLGEGKSASEVSRTVRQFLNDPDRLFHKVKNKDGNYKLSKAAAAYHPGQGVYRSSYKNAMRTTRSETNMAYRASDYERWQQLDCVVGYEVKLSNNHPHSDICDTLAGKYPKSFKFTGWHPQCRCYVIAILCTQEELASLNDKLMNGEDTTNFRSKNGIYKLPSEYDDWVKANADRQSKAINIPYFIKDNYVDGDLKKGLVKPLVSAPDPKVVLQKQKLEIAKKGALKKIAEAEKLELTGPEIDELKAAIETGKTNLINNKANVVFHKLKDAKEALKDPLSPKVLEKQFGKEATDSLFSAFEKFKDKISGFDLDKQVKKIEFEIDWVTKNGKYATSPKMVELLKRYLPEMQEKAQKAAVINDAKLLINKFSLIADKNFKKAVGDLEKILSEDKPISDIKAAIDKLNILDAERKSKLYERDISFFNNGDKYDISRAWSKAERTEVDNLRKHVIDTILKNNGNIRSYEVTEAQETLASKLNKLSIKYVGKQKEIKHIGFVCKEKGSTEFPYITAKEAERAYKEYISAKKWSQYYSTPVGGIYNNGGKEGLLREYIELVNRNGGNITHEASLPARYFAGQSFINQYLLGHDYSTVIANPGLKKLLDNFIPALSHSVNKLPRYHGVTYRGVRISGDSDIQITSVLDAFKSGKPVVYNTVMSTSTSIHTADGFGTGITFKIYGRSGIYGDDYSVYRGEKEVLMRAGTRFKVIDAYKAGSNNDIARNGNWVVILEEVLE